MQNERLGRHDAARGIVIDSASYAKPEFPYGDVTHTLATLHIFLSHLFTQSLTAQRAPLSVNSEVDQL